jgi:hypothetical protein
VPEAARPVPGVHGASVQHGASRQASRGGRRSVTFGEHGVTRGENGVTFGKSRRLAIYFCQAEPRLATI